MISLGKVTLVYLVPLHNIMCVPLFPQRFYDMYLKIIKCIDCLHFLSMDASRETYNALTNWLTDARMLASQNIVIILCGNKKDLDADREVTFLEASRFAQENGEYYH